MTSSDHNEPFDHVAEQNQSNNKTCITKSTSNSWNDDDNKNNNKIIEKEEELDSADAINASNQCNRVENDDHNNGSVLK